MQHWGSNIKAHTIRLYAYCITVFVLETYEEQNLKCKHVMRYFSVFSSWHITVLEDNKCGF